jgi:23S rRNA pseudouridine2605 synthase
VRVLGSKVDPERDKVTVDGKPVYSHKKLYLVLHKPKGCVCSKQG